MSNYITFQPHGSREELDEAQLASGKRLPRFFKEAIGLVRHAEDQAALSASASIHQAHLRRRDKETEVAPWHLRFHADSEPRPRRLTSGAGANGDTDQGERQPIAIHRT
jgi:hypothetical protein